jgi:hypothetical protein
MGISSMKTDHSHSRREPQPFAAQMNALSEKERFTIRDVLVG